MHSGKVRQPRIDMCCVCTCALKENNCYKTQNAKCKHRKPYLFNAYPNCQSVTSMDYYSIKMR
jgi:hypothetical protein